MQMLPIAFKVVGAAMTAASTIAGGNQAEAAGVAQQQAFSSQAEQRRIAAGQERAASQRNAFQERKQAEIASSNALARAAGSGGGAMDPSIVNLLGDIEAEGEYRALLETYGGNERAQNLEYGAELDEYQGRMARDAGKQAKKNSRFTALGQFVGGAASAGKDAYDMGMFGDKTPTPPAPAPKATILSEGGSYSLFDRYGRKTWRTAYG